MMGFTRARLLALVGVVGCAETTTIDHSPLGSSSTVSPVADSLITNASFEDGLVGWSTWYGDTARVTSGQRSGTGGLELGTSASAESQDVTARLQVGHTYRLSGYVKITSTSQINQFGIGMYGMDSSGGFPLNNAVMVTGYADVYQPISMDFTYPPDLVMTIAYGQLQPGTNELAYVDDFELVDTSMVR